MPYAQHMQAYQTVHNAVQVEITFEETLLLLGKFSLNIYETLALIQVNCTELPQIAACSTYELKAFTK